MFYIYELQLDSYKKGFSNTNRNKLYKEFTRYMREDLLEDSSASDCLYISDDGLWDLFEFVIVPDLSNIVLKESKTSISGKLFPNETVKDFICELTEAEKRNFDELETFNDLLSTCGILPITSDNYDTNITEDAYNIAFQTLSIECTER